MVKETRKGCRTLLIQVCIGCLARTTSTKSARPKWGGGGVRAVFGEIPRCVEVVRKQFEDIWLGTGIKGRHGILYARRV